MELFLKLHQLNFFPTSLLHHLFPFHLSNHLFLYPPPPSKKAAAFKATYKTMNSLSSANLTLDFTGPFVSLAHVHRFFVFLLFHFYLFVFAFFYSIFVHSFFHFLLIYFFVHLCISLIHSFHPSTTGFWTPTGTWA